MTIQQPLVLLLSGSMVSHKLRIFECIHRILLMQDGKLVRIYTGHSEIMELIQGSRH